MKALIVYKEKNGKRVEAELCDDIKVSKTAKMLRGTGNWEIICIVYLKMGIAIQRIEVGE